MVSVEPLGSHKQAPNSRRFGLLQRLKGYDDAGVMAPLLRRASNESAPARELPQGLRRPAEFLLRFTVAGSGKFLNLQSALLALVAATEVLALLFEASRKPF